MRTQQHTSTSRWVDNVAVILLPATPILCLWITRSATLARAAICLTLGSPMHNQERRLELSATASARRTEERAAAPRIAINFAFSDPRISVRPTMATTKTAPPVQTFRNVHLTSNITAR